MNTHPALTKLLEKADAAPQGPWQECRAKRACSCGQVWSLPLDHPVATAHRKDDDFETSPENAIACAAFIASANPVTIKKLVEVIVMLREDIGIRSDTLGRNVDAILDTIVEQ